MKYCEKCRMLSETEVCEACGARSLREATGEDFCFLIECEEGLGNMLEETFVQADIACVLRPYGDGARSFLGLSLGGYRIYVPYRQYEQAQGILDQMHDDETASLKEDLLSHYAQWHIKKPSTLKKIIKKFKLNGTEDPLGAIRDAVANAAQLSYGGLIASCLQRGHYISVKLCGGALWFNSATYEIFL